MRVRIDGLRLETGNRVELLDRRRAKPRQRAEDSALDLGHLSVLNGVHEGVLRVRGVVLELLRRVLLAEPLPGLGQLRQSFSTDSNRPILSFVARTFGGSPQR